MTVHVPVLEVHRRAVAAPNRAARWSLTAAGVLAIVAAGIAIAFPLARPHAPAEVLSVFGGLLMTIGLAQFIPALRARGGTGAAFLMVASAMTTFAGAGLLGLVSPTPVPMSTVLGVFFVGVGLTRSSMALRLKPMPGWALLMSSGMAALALATIVWFSWLAVPAWVVGALLAVDFLGLGFWLLAPGPECLRPGIRLQPSRFSRSRRVLGARIPT